MRSLLQGLNRPSYDYKSYYIFNDKRGKKETNQSTKRQSNHFRMSG